MLRSFATTVVTPRKWLGAAACRVAAEDVGEALDLDVRREARRGRPRRRPGRRRCRRRPRRPARRSRSSSRGYASRSSPSPNCVGFTKRLMTTTSRLLSRRLDQAEVARRGACPSSARGRSTRPAAARAASAARSSATRAAPPGASSSGPSAPQLAGPLGERLVEGASSGARSASASRWSATVSSSPRAIGPVSASAPASAQLAARAKDERREDLAAVLDAGGRRSAAPRTPRARPGSWTPSRPPRGRRRGRPRAPRTAASRGARRARSPRRGPAGSSRRSRTARRARSVWAVGIVWSGWSEKVSQPACGGGRERIEAGRAADVADDVPGSSEGAIRSHAARIAVVGDAEKDDRLPAGQGRALVAPEHVDLDAGGARCARDRAAGAARPSPRGATRPAERAQKWRCR